MHTLASFFRQQAHHPSPDHWAALHDIADTIQVMADGTCAERVFLSSCDPGTGKTQTVVHVIRALVQDGTQLKTGCILCVGRIEEAKALTDELALPPGKVAVLTSNAEANALGCANVQQAQVLITTQQRIEMQCRGTSFEAASQFHYPESLAEFASGMRHGCLERRFR